MNPTCGIPFRDRFFVKVRPSRQLPSKHTEGRGEGEREKQEEKEISNSMQRDKERKNTIKRQEKIFRNCFFFLKESCEQLNCKGEGYLFQLILATVIKDPCARTAVF